MEVIKLFKTLKKRFTAAALSAVMAAVSTVSVIPAMSANAVDTNNDDWLHAEGSRLYDSNGNEVWLTGANWFGFNCGENVPHYLWSADCDDVLSSIADHGINVIRFPISTELILSWMNGTPNEVSSFSCNNDPAFTINKDFVKEGTTNTPKNSMEIFDILMKKLKKYGLKCFVDIHSPDANNSGHNYNLWYGKETADGTMVTTDVWIDTLTWLADKYSNDDTILGYDLKNEPHGKGPEGSKAAKWDGSTDENNWAYAATKCANSILKVNPNALIFVEGVEQSVKSDKYTWGQPDSKTDPPYIPAWWGGNLRGVKDYPVTPDSGTSQIVYSPHDYGPGVYNQTWFQKDFTTLTLLDDYWYDTWAYVNDQNIAPLLMGEWGGFMDGDKNEKWLTLLRDYMIDNHINHTFWCLNTNSGDTGGLWTSLGFQQGSGTTIEWDADKYALLKPALWQTKTSGKFIGLDHATSLGTNGTGISVSDYYASYAKSEGSNLNAGKGGSAVEPATKNPSETTGPEISELKGDVNNDGKLDTADIILFTRFILKSETSKDKLEYISRGDMNSDKKLNVIDLSLLREAVSNQK